MVHVAPVAQLVDHQVTNQAGVKEQDAQVQADSAVTGMTPPAGALSPDVHSIEAQVSGQRQIREQGSQSLPGLF